MAAALAVACLSLLVFAGTRRRGEWRGRPRTRPCRARDGGVYPGLFPVPHQLSATAGPVTNVGLDQAVYVEVTGVPVGDELEIAYCSLAGTGTEIEAQPQCSGTSVRSDNQPRDAEPTEYVYVDVASNQTILSIPTDYDPTFPATAGSSGEETIQRVRSTGLRGPRPVRRVFFCDNAANPCGVEVMDIPCGRRHAGRSPTCAGYSPLGHAVIFPVTFSQSGNGCGSAPDMAVDASYSVDSSCRPPGRPRATMPGALSCCRRNCSRWTVRAAPPAEVRVPDRRRHRRERPRHLHRRSGGPGDPRRVKAAGGKFAYIPIAVSATEIATLGGAGFDGASRFRLDSYQLTPAPAAGVMTQQWIATREPRRYRMTTSAGSFREERSAQQT